MSKSTSSSGKSGTSSYSSSREGSYGSSTPTTSNGNSRNYSSYPTSSLYGNLNLFNSYHLQGLESSLPPSGYQVFTLPSLQEKVKKDEEERLRKRDTPNLYELLLKMYELEANLPKKQRRMIDRRYN